ncbi:MAG: type II toxin-antitoxin system RelE/ParE family toxin [Clostridia bacterium]
MYKLQITSLASKELDEIVLYISCNLKNPIAATNFLDEVEKCYAMLKSNPKIYEYCQDERLYKLRYRKVVVKNYVLIYRIDEASKTVYVLHIFYGKRDYQKLI